MDLKNKRHLNATRNIEKQVNEHPSNLSGKEGSKVFFTNKKNFNSVEEYVKLRGQWINKLTGRPLEDKAKTRRKIKIRAAKKRDTSRY